MFQFQDVEELIRAVETERRKEVDKEDKYPNRCEDRSHCLGAIYAYDTVLAFLRDYRKAQPMKEAPGSDFQKMKAITDLLREHHEQGADNISFSALLGDEQTIGEALGELYGISQPKRARLVRSPAGTTYLIVGEYILAVEGDRNPNTDTPWTAKSLREAADKINSQKEDEE